MPAFPMSGQFEEYLRQQFGIGADAPYLEGREEAETEFIGKLGGFQERGIEAKEDYLKPDKADTLDWILRGLGIALPTLGAIVGGKSTGSKKARGIMTGLGRAASEIGRGRRMGDILGKERKYKATMGQLEDEYGMAKDIYGAQIGGLEAGRYVLESDRRFMLDMAAEQRQGLPKPEDERLAFDREKFEYDKEQDRLDRQLQNAKSTGQYPESYLQAVSKLNQSLSANIDLAEDQKREAFDMGVLRLNRLYGITPSRSSLRLGTGFGTTDNTGASALLEQLRQEQGPLETLR